MFLRHPISEKPFPRIREAGPSGVFAENVGSIGGGMYNRSHGVTRDEVLIKPSFEPRLVQHLRTHRFDTLNRPAVFVVPRSHIVTTAPHNTEETGTSGSLHYPGTDLHYLLGSNHGFGVRFRFCFCPASSSRVYATSNVNCSAPRAAGSRSGLCRDRKAEQPPPSN